MTKLASNVDPEIWFEQLKSLVALQIVATLIRFSLPVLLVIPILWSFNQWQYFGNDILVFNRFSDSYWSDWWIHLKVLHLLLLWPSFWSVSDNCWKYHGFERCLQDEKWWKKFTLGDFSLWLALYPFGL